MLWCSTLTPQVLRISTQLLLRGVVRVFILNNSHGNMLYHRGVPHVKVESRHDLMVNVTCTADLLPFRGFFLFCLIGQGYAQVDL